MKPPTGLATIFTVLTATTIYSEQISTVTWNVEDFDFGGRNGASGSDGARIAIQLRDDFNNIDVFGLQEVNSEDVMEVYTAIAGLDEDGTYQYIYGKTGNSIRLGLLVNSAKFEVADVEEIDFGLSPTRTRFPLAATLVSKTSGAEVVVVVTHFARGNEQNRFTQANLLRQWGEDRDKPIIALGDFNFDYNIITNQRHGSYDSLTESGYFKWVEPRFRVDTSWSGDGQDSYPDQILDFVFAGGTATDWSAVSYVYVREGDFPDNGNSADHRPVFGIFQTDASASLDYEISDYLPRLLTPSERSAALKAFTPRITTYVHGIQESAVDSIVTPRALGDVISPQDFLLPGGVGGGGGPDELRSVLSDLGYFTPGADPNDFPPELLPYILTSPSTGISEGDNGR